MQKRVPVEPDIVRFSLSYVARRVLRRALGKGGHDLLASRIADEAMKNFARSRWEVHRLDIPPHSTPGRRLPFDADDSGSGG